MVRSAIKNRERAWPGACGSGGSRGIDPRLNPPESLPDYERSGREELVAQLKEEIAVLMAYLLNNFPRQRLRPGPEAIAQTAASGPRDLGKVMKEVMPKTKGRAEGKVVNQIVRRLLEELQA